jgi:hypothetical protein
VRERERGSIGEEENEEEEEWSRVAEPLFKVGRQQGWRPPVRCGVDRLPRAHLRAPARVVPYYPPRAPVTLAPFHRVQIWNKFLLVKKVL